MEKRETCIDGKESVPACASAALRNTAGGMRQERQKRFFSDSFGFELTLRFAYAYHYRVEFRAESITARLNDAEFGKVDLLSGGILKTPERAERVIFPDTPVYTAPVAVMVRGGAVYPVRFSVFSGGSEGECTVEIRYAGESYNPFAEAESLQTRIVRPLVTEIFHKREKGENLLCMRLG